MLWPCCGLVLSLVWACPGMLWPWCGLALGLVWVCPALGLGLPLAWSRLVLGLVWACLAISLVNQGNSSKPSCQPVPLLANIGQEKEATGGGRSEEDLYVCIGVHV